MLYNSDHHYQTVLYQAREDGEPRIANILTRLRKMGIDFGRFNDHEKRNTTTQARNAAAIDKDIGRAWAELGYTKSA